VVRCRIDWRPPPIEDDQRRVRFMKRTLLACTIVALVVHIGCGRKADQEAESPDQSSRPPAVESDAADASSASRMPPQELTLDDIELDLELTSIPDTMTLAYRDQTNLQLVSRTQPSVSFTVRSFGGGGEFEASRYHGQIGEQVRKYAKGVAIGSGDFADGPYGDSAWSAWRYEEDGEMMEIVELVSPHPQGRGVVQLRAMYPVGVADADKQAAALRGLLDRVEATG
jgi:hypothetical protein